MGLSAKAIEKSIKDALALCASASARTLWFEMQTVIKNNSNEQRLGYLERDGKPLSLYQIAQLAGEGSLVATEARAENLVNVLTMVRVRSDGNRINEPLVQWMEETPEGRSTPIRVLFSPPQYRACKERLRVRRAVAKSSPNTGKTRRRALTNAAGALANAVQEKPSKIQGETYQTALVDALGGLAPSPVSPPTTPSLIPTPELIISSTREANFEPVADISEIDPVKEMEGWELSGMHPSLMVPELRVAIALWIINLRSRGKGPTPMSMRFQLAHLTKLGPEKALAAVNYSIRQNYDSIQEDKDFSRNANGHRKPKTGNVGRRINEGLTL